jgi:NAD(P)-dependent dehydrogenase (short-subunit alcohol dehydrogenase family)
MENNMAWTLVTGGAKRMGADVCRHLASLGYDIVVHYKSSSKEAVALAEECQSFGVKAAVIQGDFSTLSQLNNFCERYLEQFDQTENLINNVGNYFMQSAMQTEIEDWLNLFQTNLHAPFLLIKKLMPTLTQQKGSIINIGMTGLSSVRANTYATSYFITKQALWHLTRSLAKEVASQGVRVNMVSPGILDIAVDLDVYVKSIPMQRPATCQEVSQVVAFLLDRKNSYITGQNIDVAGGVGL